MDEGTKQDVDGLTGQPVSTDASGDTPPGTPADTEGAPPPTEAPEGDASEPFELQIGEEKFNEEQVLAAFNALKNEKKWRAELSEAGERNNALLKALEEQRLRAINPVYPASTVGGEQPQQGTLDGERFRSLMENDPDSAMSELGNFVQREIESALGSAEARYEAKSQFLREYGDFDAVIATPEFRQFAQARPMFNDVNAYFAYKLHEAEGKVKAAEEQGFLKGEQKTINDIKAKGAIRILKGGGAAQPAPNPPDLTAMSQTDFLNAATKHLLKMRGDTGG